MAQNNAVVTHQLTPDELKDLLEGKRPYEEIIANKKPVKHGKSYSKELDMKTYFLMQHDGMTDIDIARHYGMKVKDVSSHKAKWGMRDLTYK